MIHSALSVCVCVCVRVSLRADVPGNAVRLTGMVSWNEELDEAQPHWESQQKSVCECVCQAGGVIQTRGNLKAECCIKCNL